MTLQEAIKSGRRFRRRGALSWNAATPQTAVPNQQIPVYNFVGREILADDWEVEEIQITITESVLKAAWIRACQNNGYHDDSRPIYLYAELIKELGL